MRLTIDKMVYGGSGLARVSEGTRAGGVVFVPFTLPGEVVEADVADDPRVEEAVLIKVATASGDRVAPRCQHFGACGGCQYQHADYKAQTRIRAEILHETLERAGLSAVPEIQLHAAGPWEYRNRTRLRIEEIDGALRVGYNRRGSNEFLPVVECPILAPLLWRAASALLEIASENTVVARSLRGAVEVELFATPDETKLQMTLFTRSALNGLAALCERMKAAVPELVGAGVALLPSTTASRRAQRPRAMAAWGAEGLNYPAGSEMYWVSRGGFFQVNRFLIDEMAGVVTRGRRGAVAWDLYAGVGLFSRVLAKSFAQVVAVEAAADDLARSFTGKGRRAVAATTLDFLRGAVLQRERPELIVMDPPRAGVGLEVCGLLAKIGAPEMVYVSCDPVTLARDLRALVDSGYRLVELQLIDMFPQTFHLETVAVLER